MARQPSARLEDLKIAKNFVDQALSEIVQGKPVTVRRNTIDSAAQSLYGVKFLWIVNTLLTVNSAVVLT